MLRELSIRAVLMGSLAAFVGYASSFAIVLSGLTAAGASNQQAAVGLFFATLGMGVCSVWLAFATRTPAAVAWSTPGAAFLASTQVLPGGFAEASGAFILCAGLIIVTGFVPVMGRMVAAIPKQVASALLAGVLLNLCFAPALSLGTIPLLVLPIMVAWLLGLIWNKLAAMPFAVITFIVVLLFVVDAEPGQTEAFSFGVEMLSPLTPQFTIQALISISLPLYLVTMAGQNIPGFTLLELNEYPVDRPTLMKKTGLVSLFIAPFGAITVNMSAITAAMMCGDDAGQDPTKRYWAAATSGVIYIALAFASGTITQIASQAPAGLITAVAGLALIPALVASISTAFSKPQQLEAPALTFLIAASGMTLFGISGAFWGVVVGVIIWMLKRIRQQSNAGVRG